MSVKSRAQDDRVQMSVYDPKRSSMVFDQMSAKDPKGPHLQEERTAAWRRLPHMKKPRRRGVHTGLLRFLGGNL
jgi:hypothetical protein